MKKLNVIALLVVQAATTACYGGKILDEGAVDASTGFDPGTGGAPTAFGPSPGDVALPLSNDASDASAVNTSEIQAQLLIRWNTTVADNPSDFTATTGFDFYWPTFNQFPHPTYKGGSQAAYQEFARLLLLFMQDTSNFQFLADNHLFDIRLSYSLSSPNPQSWSFTELVDQMSADGAFGNISADTKSGLRQISAQIAAAR